MNSHPQHIMNIPLKIRPGKPIWVTRWLATLLLMACAASLSAQPFQRGAATLVEESCLPANNAIDPGETNRVNFVIRNVSGGERTNVRVSLLAQNNVNIPSAQVTVGTLANNAEATVSFTFVAGGSCGGEIRPTLRVTADGASAQDLEYGPFTLGALVSTVHNFANTASINIRDNNTAEPYPSQISVSNLPQDKVTKVTVTLHNLSHTFSRDIDALLVGPQGQTVILMSDTGGPSGASAVANNVTLTFDDAAAANLPANAALTSGTFKPTNFEFGTADAFPSPAPAAPWGSQLSAFNNVNPNGAWRLFIVDDEFGDSGAIAGGWTLNITTTDVVCCVSGFPTVQPIADQTTNEDTIINVPVTFSDVEYPADQLTVLAESSNQTLVPNANIVVEGTGGTRNLRILPATNQFGVTIISVHVTNPKGNTSTASFQLTVTFVNDPPTISAIRDQVVNVGTPTPWIPFTVGDVETPAEFLMVTGSSSDQNVVPNANIFFDPTLSGANRAVRIVPNDASTSGQTTISITVTDGHGGTTVEQFLVAFDVAPGHPTITPIANQTTDEDTAKTVVFFVGDATTPPDQVQVTATSSNTGLVPNANLSISVSGEQRTLTIIPAANQFGTTTITVTARNNANNISTRQFTLVVLEVNDPPTITGLPAEVETNEDTATAAIPFTVGDVETPAANLTLSSTVANPELVSSVTFGGSGANRTVTITPAPNQFGRSEITITVTDTGKLDGTDVKSTSASFLLRVHWVNDPPTIAQVPSQTFVEDFIQQTVQLTGITRGPDNEPPQNITITATSSNPAVVPHPTVTYTSPNSTGSLTFTSATNAFGVAEITVTVRDDGGTERGGQDTTTMKFNVTVTPVNDPPTMSAIANQITRTNTAIGVQFTVGDVETPADELVVTGVSSNQGLVRNEDIIPGGSGANRFVTIIPGSTAGTVTITLTVTDKATKLHPDDPETADTAPKSFSRSFEVVITDEAENRPPTISTISNMTINEDTVGTAVFTVDDPDTGAGSLVILRSSNNQALIPNDNIGIGGTGATRTVAVFPLANQNSDMHGPATITITARDPGGLTASTSFVVTVLAVEDPPTISTITAKTTNEDTPTDKIDFTVSDPETPAELLVVTATSSNTSLVPNANIVLGGEGADRHLVVNPAANQHGTTTITVTVRDQAGLTASTAFVLTVVSVNDPPTLNAISNITINENAGEQTVNLAGITAGPANEASQQLTITASSSNTALIRNPGGGTGAIVISPSGSFTVPAGETGTGTLRFTPVPNAFGVAEITVEVTDDGGTANGGVDKVTRKFTVTVVEINAPPTITGAGAEGAIPNVTVAQNTSTGVITFMVADSETPAELLTVTATSSNQAIVPNGNIQIGGTGANRGVIITPAPDAFGTVNITVTVTDTGRITDGTDVKSASRTFALTVQAGQLPIITSIPDQSITIGDEFSDVINFRVFDAQTPANQLQVTATSSNTSLVPNNNIQISQTGEDRIMMLRANVGVRGSSIITVTVRDTDNNTASTSFVFSVVGQPPTISSIADREVALNGTTGAIAFTVGDEFTFPALLEVTRSSSNTSYIPNANVVLGGNGANRTVTVTPAANQWGESTITLTVRNMDGQTSSTSFVVSTPEPPNNPPNISAIPDLSVPECTSTAILNFMISDDETPAADLQLSASSSNVTLVPVNNIFLGGSGSNRTVFIVPACDQTGTSQITITVTDGGGKTASTEFTLTVSAPGVGNKDDFNNDDKSDILWQDDNGSVAVWFMDGVNLISASALNPGRLNDTNWRMFGTADLNRNGHGDILFQHSNGSLAVWFMSGNTASSTALLQPSRVSDANWRAFGTGDVNGNGHADILFQHTNGSLAVWYMNGSTLVEARLLNPSNSGLWRAAAAGDFNGDGLVDLVFQHPDGSVALWLMDGPNLLLPTLTNPSHPGSVDWRVVGATDLNGDGRTDLLFQHRVNNSVSVWFMDHMDVIESSLLNPSNPRGSWKIVAP
jgi:subtilisin-like proprotein convertase family protein